MFSKRRGNYTLHQEEKFCYKIEKVEFSSFSIQKIVESVRFF